MKRVGIILETFTIVKWIRIISALFLYLLYYSAYSQNNKEGIILFAKIENGDTLLIKNLPEVHVYAFLYPKSKREKRKLTRLIKNIKTVYPYAKLAGAKLKEYNKELLALDDPKARRRVFKRAEKEINSEFGKDLKNLTFSQGRILIKLIDRETGDTSYELVKELRGKFSAFFYQAFARLFGYNLKVKYDPYGKDRYIEVIVQLIEKGQL